MMGGEDPKLASTLKGLMTAGEVIHGLFDNSEASVRTREAVAKASPAELSLQLVLMVIGKRVEEEGFTTWQEVDWELVIPMDLSTGAGAAVAKPLLQLRGDIGPPPTMMKRLLQAYSSKATLMSLVGGVMKARAAKRKEQKNSGSGQDNRKPKGIGGRKSGRFGFG